MELYHVNPFYYTSTQQSDFMSYVYKSVLLFEYWLPRNAWSSRDRQFLDTISQQHCIRALAAGTCTKYTYTHLGSLRVLEESLSLLLEILGWGRIPGCSSPLNTLYYRPSLFAPILPLISASQQWYQNPVRGLAPQLLTKLNSRYMYVCSRSVIG
jgi:hypothetical protein